MRARWLSVLLLVGAAAASAPATQKTFGSPEQAAEALVKAAGAFDVAALKEILGPDGVTLVDTGEPVQDKKQAADFAALYAEKHRVERDPKNASRATLILGNEDWPAPIPIVQKKGAWSFDTKAGKQEILYRRVGRNELDAIQVCRGYVEAQDEYVTEKHDGSTVAQYAQRIIASPGKQDGLAWQNPDGSWGGPVGEKIAKAIGQGYSSKTEPYHGYHFKVLKGQGASAPMGTMDYVIKGAMIGGFALAASPAEYQVTGIKSFIVSQDGVVYERDFGKHTADWFQAVQLFNPDSKWDPVEDAEDD